MSGKVNAAERVLDLLIALINTPTRMSKAEIHRKVRGYADDPVAFERTFERDKNLLRGLGIPLITERDSVFDDDVGYRIDIDAYRVPASAFTSQELGVLALASQVWQDANWRSAAESSLTKTRGYGRGEMEDVPPLRLAMRTPESAFEPILEAIEARRPISFNYVGLAAPQSRRSIEPWRLIARHHGWYLVGMDQERGAPRAFRLSRIRGDVTIHHDGVSYEIPSSTKGFDQLVASIAPQSVVARIALAPDRAALLRARGKPQGRATVAGEVRDVVEIEAVDATALAEEIAGYGGDAVVLHPETLRNNVVNRLLAARKGASRAT